MIQYRKYYLLLLLLGCGAGYTSPILIKNSYWQCVTHDSANKQWAAKSAYKKTALNIAFDACKKQSQQPVSCKASVSNCEGFNQGFSIRPMWRCTAMDKTAEAWQSNFYSQRDDAALGAKAYCKQNSTVPETCYINVVTCVNSKEGVKM